MTDEHWQELFERLERLEKRVIALAAYLSFDEPFSNQDALVRIRCLREFLNEQV